MLKEIEDENGFGSEYTEIVLWKILLQLKAPGIWRSGSSAVKKNCRSEEYQTMDKSIKTVKETHVKSY